MKLREREAVNLCLDLGLFYIYIVQLELSLLVKRIKLIPNVMIKNNFIYNAKEIAIILAPLKYGI